MISFDTQHKQILTPLCKNCQDPHFQPPDSTFTPVGCCSYSPKITLFELYKMVKEEQHDLVFELLHHLINEVHDYTITVHAQVNPAFYTLDTSTLNKIEKIDLRIKHSICQFFKQKKGCILPASFKTSICRAFICSTVEDKMSPTEKASFQNMVKHIHQEANDFQEKHQKILQEQGYTLQNNPTKVIQYLSELDK